MVDGVTVNSLCQQGGLFALGVNGHSVILMYTSLDESCTCI